jgi:hypothetical protein
MRTRHIKHVDASACLQRIGTEQNHFPAGERSIEFVLVVAERLPMFRSQPERSSARPHAVIACGQSRAELLVPTGSDPLQIELVTPEILLGACEQFDLPRRPIAVKTRNSATQGLLRPPQRNRIGHRPQAEFVALQSRLEIANRRIERVLGVSWNRQTCVPHGISPMKPMPVWRSAESSPGALASASDSTLGPELALRRLSGIGRPSVMDIPIEAGVSRVDMRLQRRMR